MPIGRQAKVGRSIADRVLRRQPRRNAIAEIRDLLIDSDRVQDVEPDAVQAIADGYGVRLHKDLAPEREAIYREVPERLPRGPAARRVRATGPAASSATSRYHRPRGSPPAGTKAVEDDLPRMAVGEAIEDGRLSEEETAALLRLRDDLTLDTKRAERIYAKASRTRG